MAKRHPLDQFLRDVRAAGAEVSQGDLHRQSKVSQPMISLMIARERRPSPDAALALEDACRAIARRLKLLDVAIPTASDLLFPGGEHLKRASG